jgi:hypothetical protein
MAKYKNLSGMSNVTHYETGTDFIIIKFKTVKVTLAELSKYNLNK